MDTGLSVKPLGLCARCADVMLTPIMYWGAETIREKAQRTHRWNYQILDATDVNGLKNLQMVYMKGDPTAMHRGPDIVSRVRVHMPRFGGWRQYVVLKPRTHAKVWHIGWIENVIGISRIPLRGPVRMLIGPGPVLFFGVNQEGKQIWVVKAGEGRIGDKNSNGKFPLL